MKLHALLLLVLAAVLPLAAPRTAHAAADVSFDYFYDALLPYGEWIEVEGYGFCWRPTEVDPDWTPYSDGYWAFTDAGWTWVGYEEFAGIVYHYGRWVFVEGTGWCWVPEYEWGPAWVSWRSSEDYVGWAPLPPRAYWQPEIGISTWVDTVCDIGPGFYSFCRVRDFGAPVLRPLIVNRSRNLVIIRTTVNITNITYNTFGDSPVIYNSGPSFSLISSRCERPIPTLKLVRRTHFEHADFHGGPGRFSPNARAVGNQLLVNAPIVAPPERPAFLQEKISRVIKGDKVATGWAGVKDGKVRADLRQRFQRETGGVTPYNAPARAVAVADLKVVPAQADPNAVVPAFAGRPRPRGERPVPGIPVNPVTETAKPADPRAVSGGPMKPFNGERDGKPPRREAVTTAPVETTPPAPVAGPVPTEPRENRGPRPMREGTAGGFRPPGSQPPVAETGQPARPVETVPAITPAQAQAAAEAEKAAREQAGAQRQKMDAERLRAAQTEAEKLRRDQERTAQAEAAAREQTTAQQQRMEADRLRAAQAEAENAQTEQQRMGRQRDAEAGAAALRARQAEAATAAAEKGKMQAQQQQRAAQAERDRLQADQERLARQRESEAAAALREKQRDTERQAEAARQADHKRQQMEAQAGERQRQQQEQIAAQRQQLMEQQRTAQETAQRQVAERAREQQADQQRAAQEAARQQTAERTREQQMQQQHAAQEAAKQQAAERAREQQMQQQHAAQEAAKQQAAEQHRQQQMEAQRAAQDAARQQAATQQREQQIEAQRAAQTAAKQQAVEQQRQQQMEQQRAAQDAARQQAGEQQRRAMEAQREQAGRQQAEAQRAAQQAAQAAQAAQSAQEGRRGEREKDKDKEKEKGR